jgi:hypothetical protein
MHKLEVLKRIINNQVSFIVKTLGLDVTKPVLIKETGDLFYVDSDSILQRLPIGFEGQILMSNGIKPYWVSPVTPIDAIPVIDSVTVTDIEDTAAVAKLIVNESGTYYFLVYEADVPDPDAATIKAQGTAVAKGTNTITGGEEKTINISGLSPDTMYSIHFVVEDSTVPTANISLVSNVPFTTAEDVVAPVITGVSVDDIADTTATLNFTTNEDGIYYYIIRAAAAAVPVLADFLTPGDEEVHGTDPCSTGAVAVSLTELTAETAYKVYLLVEDLSGNQADVETVNLTTIEGVG